MKIIISPAKKMNVNGDELIDVTSPMYSEEASWLWGVLRGMELEELRRLWGCSEKLARENWERLHSLELDRNLTPALISYEGIQYQYMAPLVFSDGQWEYVNRHLRILSGMYGVLRPGDGVVPYRLEMQARLSGSHGKDLYAFWGDKICKSLTEGEDWLLNLASKEYSRAVEPYLPEGLPFVSCVFAELVKGVPKVKGTQAKMARGEMVRWLAQKRITDVSGVKEFASLGYVFEPSLSGETSLVFLKTDEKKAPDMF